MNDNALVTFLVSAVNNGLAARAISGVNVKQRYQPTTQGLPSLPTIYLHKIASRRYGYLKTTDSWDATNNQMVHTEEQPIITTYQINATAIQDPANATQITAGDYVELAASILNSDAAREYLRVNAIQVERIKDGRTVYWRDDKARFETDPSYDCSFVHSNVTSSIIPSTAKFLAGIYPV